MKKDAKSAQKQIGTLFQDSGYFDNLTVKEALSMFAQMYQKALSPKEALAYMDANELLDQKVKNLSGGQKQKFGIALSLINQPKLLFLNEPTTGLDPDARLQLWKTIKKLQGKTTIVICSHYLDEVVYLCDRVCFIYQGNVYATDTPEGLIKKSQAQTKIEFECLDPATLIEKSNGLLKKADLQPNSTGRYVLLTKS